MKLKLPDAVLEIINQLESYGFEAYVIGGAVRDFLLDRNPKDYDIATNATPKDMKELFKSYRIIETGLKHNTLTIRISHQNYEITTFKGKTLIEDLKNRDFTINSLAYHPKQGLIDVEDSLKDLTNGIIKINHPTIFQEDPLRTLRALRFCVELGFTIEESTKSYLFRDYVLLKEVAAERISDEFIKILISNHAYQILEEYQEVFCFLIPEFKQTIGFIQHHPYHPFDVWKHTLLVLKNVDKTKILCLAALFHDIGKVDCFTMDNGIGHFYGHEKLSKEKALLIMNRLKLDNDTKDLVSKLIIYHDIPLESKKTIKKLLNVLGKDLFFDLIRLKKADLLGQALNEERLKELAQNEASAKEILKANECFTYKDLKITGNDLKQLGFVGKTIGMILDEVLTMVIEEKLENKKDSILEYVLKSRN